MVSQKLDLVQMENVQLGTFTVFRNYIMYFGCICTTSHSDIVAFIGTKVLKITFLLCIPIAYTNVSVLLFLFFHRRLPKIKLSPILFPNPTILFLSKNLLNHILKKNTIAHSNNLKTNISHNWENIHREVFPDPVITFLSSKDDLEELFLDVPFIISCL